jgi:hypothetical protein
VSNTLRWLNYNRATRVPRDYFKRNHRGLDMTSLFSNLLTEEYPYYTVRREKERPRSSVVRFQDSYEAVIVFMFCREKALKRSSDRRVSPY